MQLKFVFTFVYLISLLYLAHANSNSNAEKGKKRQIEIVTLSDDDSNTPKTSKIASWLHESCTASNSSFIILNNNEGNSSSSRLLCLHRDYKYYLTSHKFVCRVTNSSREKKITAAPIFLRTDNFTDTVYFPYVNRVMKNYPNEGNATEKDVFDCGNLLFDCINALPKSCRPLVYAFDNTSLVLKAISLNRDVFFILALFNYLEKNTIDFVRVDGLQTMLQVCMNKLADLLIGKQIPKSLLHDLNAKFRISLELPPLSYYELNVPDFTNLNLIYHEMTRGKECFQRLWTMLSSTESQMQVQARRQSLKISLEKSLASVFQYQLMIKIDSVLSLNLNVIIKQLNEFFAFFETHKFNYGLNFFNQKYLDKYLALLNVIQERMDDVYSSNIEPLKCCLKSLEQVYFRQFYFFLTKIECILLEDRQHGLPYLKESISFFKSVEIELVFANLETLFNILENSKDGKILPSKILTEIRSDKEFSSNSRFMQYKNNSEIWHSLQQCNGLRNMLLNLIENQIDIGTALNELQRVSLRTRVIFSSAGRLPLLKFFNQAYAAITKKRPSIEIMKLFIANKLEIQDSIYRYFTKNNFISKLKDNAVEFVNDLLEHLIIQDYI